MSVAFLTFSRTLWAALRDTLRVILRLSRSEGYAELFDVTLSCFQLVELLDLRDLVWASSGLCFGADDRSIVDCDEIRTIWRCLVMSKGVGRPDHAISF